MKQKVLLFAFGTGLLLGGHSMSAQSNITAKSTLIKVNSDKSITVTENAVVPASNVYYLYDDAMSKLLVTYNSGQTVQIKLYKLKKTQPKKPPEINCVEVNCPGGFGPNVKCWKCK